VRALFGALEPVAQWIALMALTRTQLDNMHCSTPGCDHSAHDGLMLVGKCHPRAAQTACYRDGVLVIACALCRKIVMRIAVEAHDGH
jgi:hypothetical protein